MSPITKKCFQLYRQMKWAYKSNEQMLKMLNDKELENRTLRHIIKSLQPLAKEYVKSAKA